MLSDKISKHYGDFNGPYYPHSFRTTNRLGWHEIVSEHKDFSNFIMCFENTKILELNQYKKSDKAPFVIYTDLECLTEKINGWKNNPDNTSTTKVSKCIPLVFSMSIISSFKSIENKHDVYRDKDYRKTFCRSLREHAMKIINSLKVT